MHESVLMAGAEIDTGCAWDDLDIRSKRWLDRDSYVALLEPIINVIGIAIQAPSEDAEKTKMKIWRLIEECEKELHVTSNPFVETSLIGFVCAYADWIKNHPDRVALKISQLDPLGAVTVGWYLVQRAALNNGSIEAFSWGLGILGWVATIYSKMRTCRYCFRWSVPNSPFCFKHTQSLSDKGNGGKAYMGYRAGLKTLELANKRGIKVRYKPSLVDNMYWRGVLGEYLFFNIPSEDNSIELRQVLGEAPRVLNLLGGKQVLLLADKHLFQKVREQINPMELHTATLITNIPLAEKLLSLEEDRKPGRPAGKRIQRLAKMIEKAKLMFSRGLRPSEVAVKLRVSKSTVSNWISRYDDVRYAYMTPKNRA